MLYPVLYRKLSLDSRLDDFVFGGWQLEDDHEPAREEHFLPPDRLVCLSFYSGHCWHGSPLHAEVAPMPQAMLFGMSLQPLRIVSRGFIRCLAVYLYPWAALRMFGWRLGPNVVGLDAAHAAISREIRALLTLGHWGEAIATLEHWLLRLRGERMHEPGTGILAASALYDTRGDTRIDRLAETLDISPRQLERAFAREVGVGAKTLARLIRFSEAHERLTSAPDTPLATLACDLGFADQAHLTRDFRALSYTTPAAFARSRHPAG